MVAFEVYYSCVRLGTLKSTILRAAASDRHAGCRGLRVSALWPGFGAQRLLFAPTGSRERMACPGGGPPGRARPSTKNTAAACHHARPGAGPQRRAAPATAAIGHAGRLPIQAAAFWVRTSGHVRITGLGSRGRGVAGRKFCADRQQAGCCGLAGGAGPKRESALSIRARSPFSSGRCTVRAAPRIPRFIHPGSAARQRTGDQLLPVLCHCPLGQDIPRSAARQQAREAATPAWAGPVVGTRARRPLPGPHPFFPQTPLHKVRKQRTWRDVRTWKVPEMATLDTVRSEGQLLTGRGCFSWVKVLYWGGGGSRPNRLSVAGQGWLQRNRKSTALFSRVSSNAIGGIPCRRFLLPSSRLRSEYGCMCRPGWHYK